MRRIHLAILLATSLALTLVLSACGGTTLGTAPAKALSQAAATQVATTALTADTFVAQMIAPGGYSPMGIAQTALKTAGLQPAQSSSCTISESPSNPVDNDGDGWYASATSTINCDFGGGSTISGTITESDNNDNDPYSGVSAQVKDLKIASPNGSGGTSSVTYNMTWDLSNPDSSGTYALNYSFTLAVADSSNGSATFEVKGSPTYTPDSGQSDPFLAGTFTFDGSVTYADSSATYKLTRTSSGVHYSDSCGGFDSGTVDYADNQGNTASVSYTGCQAISLSYNGSTVF